MKKAFCYFSLSCVILFLFSSCVGSESSSKNDIPNEQIAVTAEQSAYYPLYDELYSLVHYLKTAKNNYYTVYVDPVIHPDDTKTIVLPTKEATNQILAISSVVSAKISEIERKTDFRFYTSAEKLHEYLGELEESIDNMTSACCDIYTYNLSPSKGAGSVEKTVIERSDEFIDSIINLIEVQLKQLPSKELLPAESLGIPVGLLTEE